MNLNFNLEDLLNRIVGLVPTLLVGLLLSGIVYYGATQLAPEVRINQALSAQVTQASEQLFEEATSRAVDSRASIASVNGQLDMVATALGEAAITLWTDSQIDDIIAHLYTYADEAEVAIASLVEASSSGQTRGRGEVTQAAVAYNERRMGLTVTGDLPKLMNFVARLRELAAPTVRITNVSFSGGSRSGNTTLGFDLTIYTSPSSSGIVSTMLPDRNTPTAVPPTPTLTFTPSITPTNTFPFTPSNTPTQMRYITATPAPTNTPTSTPTMTPSPTQSPTPTPTLTPVIAQSTQDQTALMQQVDSVCEGATPTIFQVGDIITVDFNELGALRIMTWIGDNGASTITQAYDGDQLALLAGPVCGAWEGQPIWYWYVETERQGTRGWAGEAPVNGRWMCPIAIPECAP